MLATPAVMPAASVGETAGMAGLATRSTAGDSSCTGTVFVNGTTDLSPAQLLFPAAIRNARGVP